MKLSVITVNRNHLSGLKATFASVLEQSNQDFEFIVIDGASTDGSAEFLAENAHRTHYCVSEPDSGIYNAMNKGIRKAHGDYVLFMNSGDVFYDKNVVDTVLPHLDGINELVIGSSIYPDGFVHKMPPGMKLKYFWGNSLPHQATFIAHDLFNKYGYYREDYRCSSDLFFFFEIIYLKKIPFKSIPIAVCQFEGGGISFQQIGREEHFHYMNHHMPFIYMMYCYSLVLYAPIATLHQKIKTFFRGA